MKIEDSFILPKSSLSLTERLQSCSFSWINLDINESKIKGNGSRLYEEEIKLVSFGRPIGREEISKLFYKNNLVHCSIYELLDLIKFFPNFYSLFPVYALGTEVILNYQGKVTAYPCLKFTNKKKEMCLPWYQGEFSEEAFFIARFK